MQPEASAMPGEILSPSQASTFLGCSAKYRYKYLLGIPDPAELDIDVGGRFACLRPCGIVMGSLIGRLQHSTMRDDTRGRCAKAHQVDMIALFDLTRGATPAIGDQISCRG